MAENRHFQSLSLLRRKSFWSPVTSGNGDDEENGGIRFSARHWSDVHGERRSSISVAILQRRLRPVRDGRLL